MKVLFLDVDGVLNNRASMELALSDIHPPGPLGSVFTVNKECVALLRQVVEELDLKIVLSSTWRFHPHAFMTSMEWCDWKDIPLIEKTGRDDRGLRGKEIDSWLEQHPEVEKYCIVDDSIKDIHQRDRLVRCDTEIGLTEESICKIKSLME